MAKKTAQNLIKQAQIYIHRNEKDGSFRSILDKYNSIPPIPNGYKIKYTDDWCACFVSVMAMETGMTDIIGKEVGVQRFINNYFKPKGIWIEDGTITPKPGDIICFNWKDSTQPNDGWANHIGIVEKVSNGTITTIEGNTSERVARRTYPVGRGYIRGYARPKYDKDNTKIPENTKTIPAIVQEVIDGKWGSGAERTKKLKAAGYNATEIQRLVNERLKAPTKSTTTIAREVLSGSWGNGTVRTNALKKAGYDPKTIQNEVNNLIKAQNNTTRKSVDTMAREVLTGKWGSGAARKKALTDAGYDYNTIQRAVNNLLRK